MIPADLLNQLREKDPGLWNTFSEKKIGDYFYFGPEGDEEYGDIFEYQLEDSARCAWLQHCLQEAIRARGWGYAIGRSSKGMTSASVYAQEGEGKTVMGYDEAEDLLRAYLSARSREAEDKA